MTISGDFGVWIAALLTLCVFSFLYKDNPLYKFAEHLFVGVSAGYYIALNYWTVVDSTSSCRCVPRSTARCPADRSTRACRTIAPG